MRYQAVIEYRPRPQKRHRIGRWGSYDPSAQDKQEFIEQLLETCPPPEWLKQCEALSVKMAFGFPMPKSWSKKKKAEMVDTWHSGPCDLDNACKFFLDAGNGHLWKDDRYVVHLELAKAWTRKACVALVCEPYFAVRPHDVGPFSFIAADSRFTEGNSDGLLL